MNQTENNKNNSSNSLVFGRWPQTKIQILTMPSMGEHSISARYGKKTLNNLIKGES